MTIWTIHTNDQMKMFFILILMGYIDSVLMSNTVYLTSAHNPLCLLQLVPMHFYSRNFYIVTLIGGI